MKRIISAIVALIICVPLVYIGGLPFYILALVLALLGLREFLNLEFKEEYYVRLISYVSLIIIGGSNIAKTSFDNILDYKVLGLIFLLFCLLALFNYKNKKFNIIKCFYLLGFTLFLGFSFSVMMITRNISLNYFIYLFLITITTDTFAHLVGSLLGRNKINKISPNKTYEGAIAGALFGTLISVIYYQIFINPSVNIVLVSLITLFLSIIGQFGDLFFSLIKRNYKIKDFSNIMPGHGGILDRLDSIIFVMLAFSYFIMFL